MTAPHGKGSGLIGLFTRHSTGANLLMVLMLIAGLFALSRINTQFFPDFGIDAITVSVVWPGSSAEDLDSNVAQIIEPEIRFINGVKKVTSDSIEGRSAVTLEFHPGTDMQTALADVETAVGQITTLPEDSERPVVKRIARYDTISRVMVSGPYPEAALKVFAKKIRDGLLEHGVDKVNMSGARDEEIWVEIRPETLRRLDLTLSDVAMSIAKTSVDLPSGGTRGGSERQIRSLGLLKTAQDLKQVEVRATTGGEKIRLGDIATVRDTFADTGRELFISGDDVQVRAIDMHVMRALDADALDIADNVDAYLADVIPTLPPNLRVVQHDVMSDLIRSRIELLLRNGVQGLALVLIVLFLFLNFRVGFWVAAGIPISLLATVAIMFVSGQTINMVSLFALIMMVGIVVDDAIVVGEHAEFRRKSGLPTVEAAEMGAKRMAIPVFAASITTIAAFAPLLLISDIIGKIIVAIPYVAMAVIVASLIECFLVLPGHMRHALKHETPNTGFRKRFNDGFRNFSEGPFTRVLDLALRWRYATLALALALFIVSLGAVMGGRIGFQFFLAPEADKIYANVVMAPGTPRDQTMAALNEVARALNHSVDQVTDDRSTIIKTQHITLGARVGGLFNWAGGDHTGGVTVELLPSDERNQRTEDFLANWRAAIAPVAGMDSITILPANLGPPGKDVDVRISGHDVRSLRAATDEVRARLATYAGVSSIQDDLPFGKEETVMEVTPRGRALGFTTDSVARQVRNMFQGAIAKRFPRGDEEILVRVMAPREAKGAEALADLRLRSPSGAEVALHEIVAFESNQGFARIPRQDGTRRVAITGAIDKAVLSTGDLVDALHRDNLAGIAARHGVKIHFAGRAEEQERTFADMRMGAMIGLSVIYITLAFVFANYAQPLVVMSVIPLAFVGATLGHYLLGFDLTILSMVALIGLSGIVVNDSIILVSTIKEHLAKHEDTHTAIINGARERLRAVILTSATTIGGLTPMLFETSKQAQFLIPMAVTIVFGLMVTTLLVLIVVPSLLMMIEDFAGLIQARRGPELETEAKQSR